MPSLEAILILFPQLWQLDIIYAPENSIDIVDLYKFSSERTGALMVGGAISTLPRMSVGSIIMDYVTHLHVMPMNSAELMERAMHSLYLQCSVLRDQ